MIKNITGKQFNIISSKKKRQSNTTIVMYEFNTKLITQFFNISIRNYNHTSDYYDYQLLKIFNIKKPFFV